MQKYRVTGKMCLVILVRGDEDGGVEVDCRLGNRSFGYLKDYGPENVYTDNVPHAQLSIYLPIYQSI